MKAEEDWTVSEVLNLIESAIDTGAKVMLDGKSVEYSKGFKTALMGMRAVVHYVEGAGIHEAVGRAFDAAA